jgi:hypothetical protein
MNLARSLPLINQASFHLPSLTPEKALTPEVFWLANERGLQMARASIFPYEQFF